MLSIGSTVWSKLFKIVIGFFLNFLDSIEFFSSVVFEDLSLFGISADIKIANMWYSKGIYYFIESL